jgi:hypothetical protein
MGARGTLTSQQTNFFDTFGFLKLPGPFRDDIEEVSTGFEEALASRICPFRDF